MSRISIRNLPKNAKISEDDMEAITGGRGVQPNSYYVVSAKLKAYVIHDLFFPQEPVVKR